jgi:hypothetical protein
VLVVHEHVVELVVVDAFAGHAVPVAPRRQLFLPGDLLQPGVPSVHHQHQQLSEDESVDRDHPRPNMSRPCRATSSRNVSPTC